MGHILSHFSCHQSQDNMPSTRSKAKIADENDASNAPILKQTRGRKTAISDVCSRPRNEIKGINNMVDLINEASDVAFRIYYSSCDL